MSTSVPHGGVLTPQEVCMDEKKQLLEKTKFLKQIPVDDWIASDIEMIGCGALSPLRGFMCQKDYLSVVRDMRLSNGLVWSLPVTLAVDENAASDIRVGDEVSLVYHMNDIPVPLAILTVADKFKYDKLHEVRETYRTESIDHPGVRKVLCQGDVLVGGDIRVVGKIPDQPFQEYRLSPAETRKAFSDRGWKSVVGFQTRNPIHRAHEYIQKCALEICDGLLVHPLVGQTKSDDIPADVRMRSYKTILDLYYPSNRAMLSVFPAAMRYGGPREAIFHALVRKNYGCTHFIVGRDHAGVGNFYGTYDAQLIFQNFSQTDLGITPLFFEHTFYCKACGNMASPKTCPHSGEHHLALSGTKVRQMLADGEVPPPEFTRPEVARVLIEGITITSKWTQ